MLAMALSPCENVETGFPSTKFEIVRRLSAAFVTADIIEIVFHVEPQLERPVRELAPIAKKLSIRPPILPFCGEGETSIPVGVGQVSMGEKIDCFVGTGRLDGSSDPFNVYGWFGVRSGTGRWKLNEGRLDLELPTNLPLILADGTLERVIDPTQRTK